MPVSSLQSQGDFSLIAGIKVCLDAQQGKIGIKVSLGPVQQERIDIKFSLSTARKFLNFMLKCMRLF